MTSADAAQATVELESAGPDETAAIGRALAEALPETGLFVALVGPLGAGKTVLVKGAASGLGIDPAAVSSPTFVLANRYEGRAPLVHADLYRIDSEPELLAAGFLDWLEPGALVFAEWGDRFPDALPQDRLAVRITRRSESERVLDVRAGGPISGAALAAFAAAMERTSKAGSA